MPNQRQNQVNGNSCETSVIDFDIEVDESEHLARFKWHYVSKSWYFMVYRWIFAMIVIANFIISTYQHITTVHSGVYLIYLSEWNIVLNMIVGVLGALVVTICHFHTDFYQASAEPSKASTLLRIYWSLHNIALVLALVTTVDYLTSHDNEDGHPIESTCALLYGLGFAAMFFDIFIVTHPQAVNDVMQPILYGTVYVIFSFIYYKCGGRNLNGKPYIYKDLDWATPRNASKVIAGTFVLIIIFHVILFGLKRLRTLVKHRYLNRVLPNIATITTVPTQTQTQTPNGSSHSAPLSPASSYSTFA